MAEAGLETRWDAGGNLIGRRGGSGAALVLGSHTDTVPGGGRFDGALGVMAALEVARALAEAGEELAHPLEVVDFLAEEPSDYGVSTVGSRAWAGTLSDPLLEQTNDAGETLREALPRSNADPARLAEARRHPAEIAAYLELHIEQGPVLETDRLDVAAVTGIVGIRRVLFVVEGVAAHSGTTPMALRRDALAGAAEVVLAVERTARHTDGALVATIGKATVEPNAANVVPGRVELLTEFRSLDAGLVETAIDSVRAAAEATAAARGLRAETRPVSDMRAAHADPRVLAALEQGFDSIGATHTRLASGAGHDASQVALLAPFGMLFAPSRGGVSHHPDEWTEPSQVTRAAEAFLAGIRAVDRALP
jgi:N-carbamoyl-L-amino-acid hydrolase